MEGSTDVDMVKERMRAIVWQAIAEANLKEQNARLKEIHLVMYGGISEDQVRGYFDEIRRSTKAEEASLVLYRGSQRYICWNCCGLRYEAEDTVCPNCGETGVELPEESAFGLRKFEIA